MPFRRCRRRQAATIAVSADTAFASGQMRRLTIADVVNWHNDEQENLKKFTHTPCIKGTGCESTWLASSAFNTQCARLSQARNQLQQSRLWKEILRRQAVTRRRAKDLKHKSIISKNLDTYKIYWTNQRTCTANLQEEIFYASSLVCLMRTSYLRRYSQTCHIRLCRRTIRHIRRLTRHIRRLSTRKCYLRTNLTARILPPARASLCQVYRGDGIRCIFKAGWIELFICFLGS